MTNFELIMNSRILSYSQANFDVKKTPQAKLPEIDPAQDMLS